VGWSLEHEVIFYFLAGIVLISSSVIFRVKFLLLILIALFVAGILVHAVIPDIFGIQIWDYHLLSLFHAQFLIGVAIFMLRERIAALNYGVLILAASAELHWRVRCLPTFFRTEGYGRTGCCWVCGRDACGGVWPCIGTANLGPNRSGAAGPI
jgi:hypothetical protein